MSHSFIFISVLIALTATVGALIFGLFALLKGGKFNQKYGNQAMQWRVILQAISLILFTLMLILGR